MGTFSQRLGLKQTMKMYRGGGVAHFTARKGDFGLFTGITYGDLDHQGTASYGFSPLEMSFDVKDRIQWGMLEAGALYRFERGRVSFDALAGVRYMNAKTHFTTGNVHVDANKIFYEPMVGGDLSLRLSESWSMSARMCASGFGLGSELTTDTEARISYNASDRVNVFLGYRVFDMKYDQDAGSLIKPAFLNNSIPLVSFKDIEVSVECVVQGPVAGIELRW